MTSNERVTPLGSMEYLDNAGEYIQLMQAGRWRAVCQFRFTRDGGCQWVSELCDSKEDARDELLIHCGEEHRR